MIYSKEKWENIQGNDIIWIVCLKIHCYMIYRWQMPQVYYFWKWKKSLTFVNKGNPVFLPRKKTTNFFPWQPKLKIILLKRKKNILNYKTIYSFYFNHLWILFMKMTMDTEQTLQYQVSDSIFSQTTITKKNW